MKYEGETGPHRRLFSARTLTVALTVALLGYWVGAGGIDRHDHDHAGVESVAAVAAPPLAIPSLTGETVRLADYRGKWTLVHFWATWCSPCVTELPTLQAAADRTAPTGLAVVTVNLDVMAPERIEAWMGERGIALTTLRDPRGETAARWEVRTLPSSYLVDPAGMVVAHAVGPRDWESASIRAYLAGKTRQGAEAPGE